MAAIIAHEDMRVYAYISIIEAVLRLGLVFVLKLILFDKLKLYGLLMCLVSCVNTAIYRAVSRLKYKEVKSKFYWNFEMFKELISYNGWNILGWLMTAIKYQVINILLNQFFNPVVVSARAIALSVNSAVTSFRNGFTTAMNPQIIKSYAAEQKQEVLQFLFFGTKIICFLLYVVALPLFLEIGFVLSLWLGNPPEYTGVFTRLTLIDMLVNSMGGPIMGTIAMASGKIKAYIILTNCILLLNLPLSWLALSNGIPPYSVTIVAIGLSAASLFMMLLIVKRLFDYSIIKFIREVILPCLFVFGVSAIAPLILHNLLKEDIWRLLIVSAVSVVSVCGVMYAAGLNRPERKRVQDIVMRKIARLHNAAVVK
jgi:O-antigen/teichoic acid export membrane protein